MGFSARFAVGGGVALPGDARSAGEGASSDCTVTADSVVPGQQPQGLAWQGAPTGAGA